MLGSLQFDWQWEAEREVGMGLILLLQRIKHGAAWESGRLRVKNNLVKRTREPTIKGTKASQRGIVIRGF